MRKLLLLLPLLAFCKSSEAKKVKFAVDMTGVTVSANGVHVMGDFQIAAGLDTVNWMANSVPLIQEGASQIYSTLVDIPAFQKYEYKFVNGDQSYEAEFVPDESRVHPIANDNRWLYVDSLTTDTTYVGAIMFGDQTTGAGNAPAGKMLLRFKVNMKNFTPTPTTGVHVAGDFQGFDPAKTRMYSFSDNIYEHIAYVNAGTYQYKYYNGNSSGTAETVPTACATGGNRSISVTTHTVIYPICFSSCIACFPTAVNDIDNEKSIDIAPNPARNFTILHFGNSTALHTVQLVDVSGRVAASYNNIKQESIRVDVSGLSAGLYFIKVKSHEGQEQTRKLLVQ